MADLCCRVRLSLPWWFGSFLFCPIFWSIVAANEPAPTRFHLSNGHLSRTLTVVAGKLRTQRLENLTTATNWSPGPATEEFVLLGVNGARWTTADYTVLAHSQNKEQLLFLLLPEQSQLPVLELTYSAVTEPPILRKSLRADRLATFCQADPWSAILLQLPADRQQKKQQREYAELSHPESAFAVIDEVLVESLPTTARSIRSPFEEMGQPVFLSDGWFLGVEFPGSTNCCQAGKVTAGHYPGAAHFQSHSAVLGGCQHPRQNVANAFTDYLEKVRLPTRPMLQYNSWWEMSANNLSEARLLDNWTIYQDKLLTPYHLHFDAFCIDDGYQKKNSLWEFDPERWPSAGQELRRRLQAQGSRLGLWLPLNGYHLHIDWGRRHGWECCDQAKQYYCLAGPHYQSAIREALRRQIHDGNLAYLKHDFNFLTCTATGHSHLPTYRHGREAALQALLELLQYERSLQPELWLNVTSGTWPSPWWLLHAQAIWMGGPDYAKTDEQAVLADRQAELTARDQRLYDLLRHRNAAIPINGLMTHGIIRAAGAGMHDRSSAETVAEWSDYVVWNLARGTLLQELYIDPKTLPADFWPILGHALRWWRSRAHAKARTHLIGGNPAQHDVYGFVQQWPTLASPATIATTATTCEPVAFVAGIASLRNPKPYPTTFLLSPTALVLTPSDHENATQCWYPVVIYPFRERLPTLQRQTTELETIYEMTLPANSIVVIELYATLPDWLAAIPVGRFLEPQTDQALISLLHKENVELVSPFAFSQLVDANGNPLPGILTNSKTPAQHSFVQTLGNHIDEKKRWSASFVYAAGSANIPTTSTATVALELDSLRWPAASTATTVHNNGQPVTWFQSRQPATSAWQWQRGRLSLPMESLTPAAWLECAVSLPPSPLWPTQARQRLVLRRRQLGRVRPIPSSAPWPSVDITQGQAYTTLWRTWPIPSAGDSSIEEVVLLDKVFERRRSPLEAAAWLLLFLLPPVCLAVSCHRWIKVHRPSRDAWLCIGLQLGLWIGLLLATPLRSIFIHLLTGFE